MTFEVNPAGLLELLNGDPARQFVDDVTRSAGDHARRNAPIRTGQYQDSIKTTDAQTTERGAQAELYSDDIAWAAIEFGSVNNPPYRSLTSGVIDAGLDFEESGR